MSAEIHPDLEAAIGRHFATGRYKSREDVLRAAIGRLDSDDATDLFASLADEAEGRLIALSDVADRIRRKSCFAEVRSTRPGITKP